MDKSNTKQAQYSAEIHISYSDVETILHALAYYEERMSIFITSEERRNTEYAYNKFIKLYNELKGGNNA